MRTFGPSYDHKLDETRIRRQMDDVRDLLLYSSDWWTLAEIENAIRHPQASISAQLRHLRKPQFGGYIVEKRRRGLKQSGTWEYRVLPPPPNMPMMHPYQRPLFTEKTR